MTSVYSIKTVSEKIFNDIASKSQSRFQKLEGQIDEDYVRLAWAAFGSSIARSLRMGRAVSVPKFGTFNFSAPEITLPGITNPELRDKQYRFPIFNVNKDFSACSLRQGLVTPQGLRVYKNQGGNGSIQQIKLNWAEISISANMSKDQVKMGVERVIRQLSESTRAGQSINMDIPSVGVFLVRNGIVAVKFNEILRQDVIDVTNKPLAVRQQRGESNLTIDNLDYFQNLQQGCLSPKNKRQDMQIDPKASTYLSKHFNINVKNLDNQSRMSRSTDSFRLTKVSFGSPSRIGLSQEFRQRNLQKSQSKEINGQYCDQGLKEIRFWIRQNNYSSDQAFIEICKSAIGDFIGNVKLTYEHFEEGLKKFGFKLESQILQNTFAFLDVNKDGFLTLVDWLKIIKDEGDYMNYIRDSILKNDCKVDDVLKIMKIRRDDLNINQKKLTQAFRNLDLNLGEQQAHDLAYKILKNRKTLPAYEIIAILQCIEDEGNEYDVNWFNDIQIRIKMKLLASKNGESLRQEFEKYDYSNKGVLDIANFKTCLMKQKVLGLSVQEIERLSRYIEKDGQIIDYYKFLHNIDTLSKFKSQGQSFCDIEDFVKQLQLYLQNNKLTASKLLSNVLKHNNQNNDKYVNLEQFAFYLQKFVFPDENLREILFFVRKIDIDRDHAINENDLQFFLQRAKYFVQEQKNAVEQPGHSKIKQQLTPNEPLSDDKTNHLIKELRKELALRKISYQQFYDMIDKDKNGFITIEEFCKELDQVIKYSLPIKEKFFAYFDKLNIGMIDLNGFLAVMNKQFYCSDPTDIVDNFDWQIKILEQIKNKFSSHTIEDSFRAIDADFDGFITKNDIKQFLINELNVSQNEIYEKQLERLFKLMDQFKRGKVQINDFKRIFSLNLNQNNGEFDWINNAKQQIGLVLSRQFETIEESYEQISLHTQKLIYSHLKKYIESNNSLAGFVYTDKLLLQLFSNLDSHKKGYLTQNDWSIAFTKYNWVESMFEEIEKLTQSEFSTSHDAFLYFSQNNEFITIETFSRQTHRLCPDRYTKNDIQILWDRVRNNDNQVNYEQFCSVFQKVGNDQIKRLKDGTEMDITKSFLGLNKTFGTLSNNFLGTSKSIDASTFNGKNLEIIEKRKQLLRFSHLHDAFKQCKITDEGEVTVNEFKHVLMKQKLTLSHTDINQIISLCAKQNGMINILDFQKQLSVEQFFLNNMVIYSDVSKRILQRCRQRLQILRVNIDAFMLCPQDAFRQFNTDNSGKMSFEQFENLVQRLSDLSNQPMISHQILLDLFKYIDTRNDGYLDLQEWVQALSESDAVEKEKEIKFRPKTTQTEKKIALPYKMYDPFRPHKDKSQRYAKKQEPYYRQNFLQKKFTLSAKEGHIYHPGTNSYIQPPDFTEQEYSNWEITAEYDNIMKVLGRNRKILLDIFQNISKTKKITYDVAQDVIARILNNVNITIQEKNWKYLLDFALKKDEIDYRLLLNTLKRKLTTMSSHPKSLCD